MTTQERRYLDGFAWATRHISSPLARRFAIRTALNRATLISSGDFFDGAADGVLVAYGYA